MPAVLYEAGVILLACVYALVCLSVCLSAQKLRKTTDQKLI